MPLPEYVAYHVEGPVLNQPVDASGQLAEQPEDQALNAERPHQEHRDLNLRPAAGPAYQR